MNSGQPAFRRFSDYVGIPFRFGGTDRSGIDCWGLVCLVLSEMYYIELPRYQSTETSHAEIENLITATQNQYEIITKPRAGDIALLRIAGHLCHTGIVVGGGKMLHTLAGHDSAIERYNGAKWAKRLEGFYRVNQGNSLSPCIPAGTQGQPPS